MATDRARRFAYFAGTLGWIAVTGTAAVSAAETDAAAAQPAAVLSADVTQGYRTLHFAGKAGSLKLREVPHRIADANDRSQAGYKLAFDATGLTLEYEVSQPAHASDPTTRLTSSILFKGFNVRVDDDVEIVVRRSPEGTASPKTLFLAAVNPAGICSTLTRLRSFALRHDQCTAATKPAERPSWHGTLTVPYEVLAAVVNDARSSSAPTSRTFQVAVLRYHHVSATATNLFYSSWSGVWITVGLKQRTSLALDRFFWVANGLHHVDKPEDWKIPNHRTAVFADLPLDPHTLVSAIASDDTRPLSAVRDDVLKSAVHDTNVAKGFNCVTCSSFSGDNTEPFDPLVTSKALLGVDFSSLGVDAVPFSFKAASYPLDLGLKAVLDDATFGLAEMNGTTTAGAPARDTVFRIARAFPYASEASQSTLAAGFYHAVAQRVQVALPAPASHATYPPILRPDNTSNQLLSIGWTQALTARGSGSGSDGFNATSGPFIGTIVRYGVQDGTPGGRRVDAVVSVGQDPPYADLTSSGARPYRTTRAALGYRAVGTGFLPRDGDFDPSIGLEGFYGAAALITPDKDPSWLAGASLTFRRFADGVRARDVSLGGSANIRFPSRQTSSSFGLSLSGSVATIAESQAAKEAQKPAFVSDALEGGTMLPNGSYAAQLTYKSDVVIASAGYTEPFGHNCDFTRPKSPCYAYRQPSPAMSLTILPTKTFFVDAAIRSQDTQSLGLAQGDVAASGSGERTTLNHVVRSGAVGARLFGDSCSTLLFTTENRGGDVDTFASGPPKPGFTDSASLELVPKTTVAAYVPSLLVAFVRTGQLGAVPTSEFVMRVKFGGPASSYPAALRSKCNKS